MAKAKFGVSRKDTGFGRDLIAAAREALAHKKGKVALSTRIIDPMTAARVKAIRKKVAKSPKEFERRFGVPARTLEGWEQNKKVDIAGRVLLMVIERDPDAVERALSAA
jgi:putative transcriptional regulator